MTTANDMAMTDELAHTDVIITALVAKQEDVAREARPVVVTVGIADEKVVMKSGRYADLLRLIDEAWAEYAQVVIPQLEGEAEVIGSAAAEETESEAAPSEEAEPALYSDEYF